VTILPRTLRHATHNALTTCIDVKVLAELHETLNVVEFLPVKPWHIAELLRADRSSVQRALTHLIELGYLERGDRNGNGFTFRLALPSNGQNSPPPSAAAA
jgi:DNA-binding MarR family transcriptional regulator